MSEVTIYRNAPHGFRPRPYFIWVLINGEKRLVQGFKNEHTGEIISALVTDSEKIGVLI